MVHGRQAKGTVSRDRLEVEDDGVGELGAIQLLEHELRLGHRLVFCRCLGVEVGTDAESCLLGTGKVPRERVVDDDCIVRCAVGTDADDCIVDAICPDLRPVDCAVVLGDIDAFARERDVGAVRCCPDVDEVAVGIGPLSQIR